MVFKGELKRKILKAFFVAASVSFVGSSVECLAAAPGPTYDQIFQDGLKAEANQKWPDAIQYYVLAMAKNPKSPWPKERLKALFKALQKMELPVEPYKTLLPPELLEEFLKTGVIQEHYDSESAVSRLNTWMWAGVIGLVGLIGAILLYLSIRSARAERDQFDTETKTELKKVAARKAAATNARTLDRTTDPKGIPKPPQLSKKETKITDQARANITGVVANVKSLNLDFEKIKEMTGEQKVDVEGLKDSGVINAFVQDWVTEVNIEQTQIGKFSKMTVDASLVFDEDKVENK